MPEPQQSTEHDGRDLYEAAEALVQARGRVCGVCTGASPTWDGHDVNPPCEEHAWRVFRLRLAEARATPGESEEAAKWRLSQHLFDDVARTTEAEAQRSHRTPVTLVRFGDLDDETQRRIVSGLGGVFAQFAQVAVRASQS